MIIDSFRTKEGNHEVKLNKLTVFVGPNNCGKSQTLKDLSLLMSNENSSKIVSEVMYTVTSYQSMEPLLTVSDHKTSINTKTILGKGLNFAETEINLSNHDFENSKTDARKLLEFYNRFRLVLLNSHNRAQIIQLTGTGGLENDRASNLLQSAYLDVSKSIIKEFQEIFKETFGVAVYLDYTSLSQICLRISPIEINSFTGDAQSDRGKLKDLEKIDDQGEGYKSFAATVLGLISARNRLVLLDEPEVFLHNAQQRQLGRWVGEFAKNSETQLVVSTHSSNFLEGLLASGVGVNIKRLNRVGNDTTFNDIKPDIVKRFTEDPISSSQRVLDAIFQRAVVVCEGDTDRMIYKIVADKIKPSHEILFIHSHNKQTVPSIVETLKQCAVPVYSILDIDIFHEDKEYNKVLDAHNISLNKNYTDVQNKVKLFINNNKDNTNIKIELKQELEQLLKEFKNDITIIKSKVGRLNKLFSNWYRFKKQGIDYITDKNLKKALTNLINHLKDNNLYIVEVGELENWLPRNHPKGKEWIGYAILEINKGIPKKLKEFIETIIKTVN